MKKSRIALIVCIIAVLVLACCGGALLYISLMNPSMAGFIVWEYEDVPNKDEPYTTVVLTEEIHKEYPELALLIEGSPRYEISITKSPLELIFSPNRYINHERAAELWNTFGYDNIHFVNSPEERHVLSENGKLYCLIKVFL